MRRIIVTRRGYLFYASVEGWPEIKGSGNTRNQAIGDLYHANQDFFQIKIMELSARSPETSSE